MHKSWKSQLQTEMKKPYFKNLQLFLKKERGQKNVFPAEKNVFEAFNKVPFDKVKVVIVGQDPYHNQNQAIGHAFAVAEKMKTPPSLRNIYKEIKSDTQKDPKSLLELSGEGVFLINTLLTVVENTPLSHKNVGWESFTDEVLRLLWNSEKKIVFLLWGNHAKKKEKTIFKEDHGHLVLTAGHPSPLSSRFFFGCKHFSKANCFLKKEREEVDWNKN
jgi:uracil-DNA glycosylase